MSGKRPLRQRAGWTAIGDIGSSPHACVLRAAGLKVTSARLAALRLAPEVLRNHGHLTARNVYEAACRHGYTLSPTAFHGVLPKLANAGLLPQPTTSLPSRPDELD